MRRKINFSIGIIGAILILSSCRSNTDLIYMQNLTPGEIQSATPMTLNEYLLRKGDNLYVQVTSLNAEVNALFNPGYGTTYSGGTSQQYGSLSAQYINGYQIDQDGNIDLPIIGKVNLVNQTIPEAKVTLMEVVNEYFKEASVNVKLLSFKYTVMGEVYSPGVYYNYNNVCSILEAISQAGGITDYANLKNVSLLREGETGVRSIDVDLSDKTLISSEAYFMQPNDVIYIAPDKYKNTRLNSSLYSLGLSTVSILVVILNFLAK